MRAARQQGDNVFFLFVVAGFFELELELLLPVHALRPHGGMLGKRIADQPGPFERGLHGLKRTPFQRTEINMQNRLTALIERGDTDRKSGVEGRGWSVMDAYGGGRINK